METPTNNAKGAAGKTGGAAAATDSGSNAAGAPASPTSAAERPASDAAPAAPEEPEEEQVTLINEEGSPVDFPKSQAERILAHPKNGQSWRRKGEEANPRRRR